MKLNPVSIVLLSAVVFMSGACSVETDGKEASLASQTINAEANTSESGAIQQIDGCDKIDFKYVIVSERSDTAKSRRLDVFMDPKAFDEHNLKNLFTFLSAKYPSPDRLIIKVETEWEKVNPPASCILEYGSGASSDTKAFDNQTHNAVFQRHTKRSRFTYNPKLGSSERRTIQIEMKNGDGFN